MRTAVTVVAVLALSVVTSGFSIQGSQPEDDSLKRPKTEPPKGAKPPKVDSKVAEIMRRKMAYSQRVLEGIALGDFAKIRQNADELIRLSKKAEWRVVPTPPYLAYSDEFQRAAESLAKNARAKNLDAATLSYVEMTLHCVRCHKYVREVRSARLPKGPAAEVFAALESDDWPGSRGNQLSTK